jgi:hypothetical protein
MDTVKKLEQAVKALSQSDLADFRAWFLDFDQAAWDHELESDVLAGKLDAVAEKALGDHRSGRSRPL